jgi:hypothetical protein
MLAATPGPWACRPVDVGGELREDVISKSNGNLNVASDCSDEDGNFIAHVIDDVQWLLARLAQAYTALDDARKIAFEAGRKIAEQDLAKARNEGRRDMRDRSTNALAEAGCPPEIFGIVAALPIRGDLSLRTAHEHGVCDRGDCKFCDVVFRCVLRTCVENLKQDNRIAHAAPLVLPLREALAERGLGPDCYVGMEVGGVDWSKASAMRITEWYAGQVLAVVDRESWESINTICNLLNKFCPGEE